MTLVLLPPGEFRMGSPKDAPLADIDEEPHTARVEQPFYIATTELTQAQWAAVLGTQTPPSRFVGDELPVDSVSWHDAQRFAEALSQREGKRYRLPTEAEWEYACRAGTTTTYNVGPSLTTAHANIRGNDTPTGAGVAGEPRGSTVEVGSFAANAWGLHDMHGNVWEWVEDLYGARAGTDDASGRRVLRGGAWNFSAQAARSAVRLALDATKRYDSNGLRLVREL